MEEVENENVLNPERILASAINYLIQGQELYEASILYQTYFYLPFFTHRQILIEASKRLSSASFNPKGLEEDLSEIEGNMLIKVIVAQG